MKKNTLTSSQKGLRPATKKNFVTYAMVIAFFVIFQTLSSTGNLKNTYRSLLVPICTSVIMAVSLNLVVGVLGELSLGHAGFMCVGAYAGSFFSVLMQDVITVTWIRFTLSFVVAAIAAAIAGILIGIPVLRLKGDYLAIVTLAFGEIIKSVVNVIYIGKDSSGLHIAMSSTGLNLDSDGVIILKGPQGITGTPKNSTFVIGFILVMITLIIANNLIDSRTGRAIMSIRDNRIAAESIGINVTRYKLMVFTIAAALAGCAGVLYSHNIAALTANTNNFGYNMSILVLVYVVLGGLGNIRGSVIAAAILYSLPELLRGLSDYRMLIYSIILIIMMIVNNGTFFVQLREKLSFKLKNKSKSSSDTGKEGV
ncbi:MAG: branched-chain amino acid ABC transporter permease [Clostridiales bacterium]|nr:branched-chain amino acid ABC transporter permease [Clostridiales bacterium]MCD7828582.1 branched-chain amino acid ABC transporter permease [Clostridiales bacterium]